ncbi:MULTISPECIES: N-acetylmuramoyl-L-alanine amidase family protein [Chitinophagaceae]|uniref:N-acetylmuramoyl-L-alanine amidase family protein n=1 Tax=Chitinophagaceae TaxID=563835 RepID=UPI000DEEDFFB|nr:MULTISPECIES: N-acetylmuramoyl-L-alanine amidase [Chitinophagaceae]RPD51481.1 N-acetylmuramoyl-L-alanine amidase [Paracnuella aquatica]
MLKKTLALVSLFLVGTLLFSFQEKPKVLRTIIIDAGHGGKDVGARGAFSYEKDICLGVATRLGEQLARTAPDVKLLFTRTDDSYPELHTRARMANQNKGDLFISIHVNAAPPVQHKEFTGNKTVVSYVGKGKKRKKVTRQVPQYRYYSTPNPAKGTETYIWGAHKNEDKEIAMRENAPMLAEENFQQNYGDVDVNSADFIALSLLKTKQFFKRSATLAGLVEEEFAKVGRVSRGQRQRQVGIWVLQATAMPSVLVETGYITNRAEEDYLNSDKGQEEIANCITSAVKNYMGWLEKNQISAQQGLTTGVQKQKDAEAFLNSIDAQERRRQTVR